MGNQFSLVPIPGLRKHPETRPLSVGLTCMLFAELHGTSKSCTSIRRTVTNVGLTYPIANLIASPIAKGSVRPWDDGWRNSVSLHSHTRWTEPVHTTLHTRSVIF
jgi:hypothetical protein